MSLNSALERLPAELHKEIASYFVASNSTKSIHSLASTCKRCFNIFAPFAVQTYRSSEIPKERSQSRNRNLQFLRHIAISHPELVRHVQTLDLHDWGFNSDGTESGLAIRDDEWPIYKRLVGETFPSEGELEIRKQWVKLLEEEWEDALMALLLAVCTNIRTLIYRIPKKSSIFLRVLNAGVSNQNGAEPGGSFPRLQNITQKPNIMNKSRWFLYDPSNNESPDFKFDEDFIKILQMPSLRSYECNGMTLAGDMDKEVPGKLPRQFLSIESLSITDSNCQFSSLNALLAVCRGLRAFTSTRAREKPITLEVTARDIVRALIPHSDTLEYLHLDSNKTWRLAYVLDQETFWSYAGVELKQLHRLKHLKVVIEALKGLFNVFEAVMDENWKMPPPPPFADCIPEQLECLEIRNCTIEDLPQITEFAEALENFPKLRSARFVFSDDPIECGWEEKPKDLIFDMNRPSSEAVQLVKDLYDQK